MILPPPRSTLFPYTTLFRSVEVVHEATTVTGSHWECNREFHSFRHDVARLRVARSGKRGLVLRWSDRKSTRLNSSHPSISYAVFCLKKKKKHIQYTYSIITQ